MKDVYFLDCEWISDNNKIVKKAEIISIGIVKINQKMEIVDTFYRLIKPKFNSSLPKFTTKLTGIKYEDLKDGISFQECLKEINTWIGSDCNDVKIFTWGNEDKLMFLRNMKFQKIKNNFVKKFIDIQPYLCNTIKYKNELISNQFSLSDMQKIFKTKSINAHNALDDAKALAIIYKMVKKRYPKDQEFLKYLFYDKYKRTILDVKSSYFANNIEKEKLVNLKSYLINVDERYRNVFKLKKDKMIINDSSYEIKELIFVTYVRKNKNIYKFTINIYHNNKKLLLLNLNIDNQKKLKNLINILNNF